MSMLFEIRNLNKTFDRGEGLVQVLKGIHLDVKTGESLAIMGPSGSGKSTLLHILGGLEEPTSGEVLFEGKDLYRLTGDKRAEWRNRRLGFVFQFHHLLGEFTALENTALPLLIRGESRKIAFAKASAVLGRFNLEHRLNHEPGSLSGGERERVALARALVGDPDILLADEPTGSLDHEQGHLVLDELLKSRTERGMTVIMVTHNAELAGRFDRVLSIEDGVLAL